MRVKLNKGNKVNRLNRLRKHIWYTMHVRYLMNAYWLIIKTKDRLYDEPFECSIEGTLDERKKDYNEEKMMQLINES